MERSLYNISKDAESLTEWSDEKLERTELELQGELVNEQKDLPRQMSEIRRLLSHIGFELLWREQHGTAATGA